jgi:hypothetical protein
MEFMLPDGAWDNSWGTRNYKWTWWGSRTSDGCHPAYVLLADYDPRFAEVARRNLELMSACTHNGMLYGGPDYFAHGDQPCVHHTFTHAKALATVLDRGAGAAITASAPLPRDEAYGVKHFPEIATSLVALGEWRATVTDYDWEYVEHVQAGGGSGAGHASGGALSLLYHRRLGPILAASMTEYAMIEISNQQVFTDAPHMTTTPRIECKSDKTYTSLSDYEAVVTRKESPNEILFQARGRLLSSAHKPIPEGEIHYSLTYRVTKEAVELTANATGTNQPKAPIDLIIPVVSRRNEEITQSGGSVRIAKARGLLRVKTDAKQGFADFSKVRTFNLVPGFECVALRVPIKLGEDTNIRLEVI